MPERRYRRFYRWNCFLFASTLAAVTLALNLLSAFNVIELNPKGPYLNDVYTVRGSGLPKCRCGKGGCVDLVLWMDLARMQTKGEGVQNPQNCEDII